MRRSCFAIVLASLAICAFAEKPAPSNPEAPEKITVAQLEQTLSGVHGETDAETVQALSGIELAERLSTARFARLKADLPGEKSQQELLIVADQSIFLPPPRDEIVQAPTPDPAATRQMLVQIVNYVNSTVRQLPNLMAVRETTGFEDRPASDTLQSTGIVSLSFLPLHQVGKSSVAVTYRDRKEVLDDAATKALKQKNPIGGLATSGEFGPILSSAVADALKGKITWARWEKGVNARAAVFHYEVPEEKSSYHVKFCCVPDGFSSSGHPEMEVFDERASYHGDITFDPADGSILRITLEAEMPSKGLVSNAGIAIEYGPVEIAGKSYFCPKRSVSVLLAHTAAQQGTASRTNYQGAAKTFLNDVEFNKYRRFGSETRILSVEDELPH
jgi:hypothetical protein